MKSRWIKSVMTEAETARDVMPWQRGLRRQAMIARRGGLPQRRNLCA